MYYFHLTPCDQQQMKHQTLWKPITTPCFQALLEQNTNLLPSLEADTSFSMEYRRAKTANAIRRLRKELMYKYRVKSSAETCLATIEAATTIARHSNTPSPLTFPTSMPILLLPRHTPIYKFSVTDKLDQIKEVKAEVYAT